MNYQSIYMCERAQKVDYITYCLNKGMIPNALIISRAHNELRGKIIDIHFDHASDEVYPAIYVTVILESETERKLDPAINSLYGLSVIKTAMLCEEIETRKIKVSIDDIFAFYIKDETKLEEKTMTDKEKFTPKRINFRSKKGCYYTDVLWFDGTVTVVKLKENEDFDEYTAFCAALAKKIFGSSNSVNTIVKKKTCYPLNKKQKKSIERKEDMPMAKEFMSELDKAFENLHKYK